jgi:hypothetical protein
VIKKKKKKKKKKKSEAQIKPLYEAEITSLNSSFMRRDNRLNPPFLPCTTPHEANATSLNPSLIPLCEHVKENKRKKERSNIKR